MMFYLSNRHVTNPKLQWYGTQSSKSCFSYNSIKNHKLTCSFICLVTEDDIITQQRPMTRRK